MTTKLEQAARQALEALEELHYSSGTVVAAKKYESATAAPREALEQPVSQQYQDHLVNQSFDWSAMAAKHQFMEGYRIGLAEMREACAKVCNDLHNGRLEESGALVGEIYNDDCAAAIRAIKFEGDTGFRPVSEMIAEHKQDPKKAAAIEKAKMRKATRAEKVAVPGVYEVPVEQAEQEPVAHEHMFGVRLYFDSEGNPCSEVEHLNRCKDCDELCDELDDDGVCPVCGGTTWPVKKQTKLPKGFRMHSERMEEIKQTKGKQIDAARKRLAEKAEQEPMYISKYCVKSGCACHYSIAVDGDPIAVYAAPVRTKDLTPHEITALIREGAADGGWQGFAQRVIAADREKNK